MLSNLTYMHRPFFAHQSVRFIVNGVFATALHFGVLTFNLKILGWESAGIANLVAAVFGIVTSFLGSRYYVFRGSSESLPRQAFRFISLYFFFLMLHGALMHLWSDVYGLNYVSGFLMGTLIQMLCSFWGNKLLVFKV